MGRNSKKRRGGDGLPLYQSAKLRLSFLTGRWGEYKRGKGRLCVLTTKGFFLRKSKLQKKEKPEIPRGGLLGEVVIEGHPTAEVVLGGGKACRKRGGIH